VLLRGSTPDFPEAQKALCFRDLRPFLRCGKIGATPTPVKHRGLRPDGAQTRRPISAISATASRFIDLEVSEGGHETLAGRVAGISAIPASVLPIADSSARRRHDTAMSVSIAERSAVAVAPSAAPALSEAEGGGAVEAAVKVPRCARDDSRPLGAILAPENAFAPLRAPKRVSANFRRFAPLRAVIEKGPVS
jgi:hypothetical protein